MTQNVKIHENVRNSRKCLKFTEKCQKITESALKQAQTGSKRVQKVSKEWFPGSMRGGTQNSGNWWTRTRTTGVH